jgi:hypothetical protein
LLFESRSVEEMVICFAPRFHPHPVDRCLRVGGVPEIRDLETQDHIRVGHAAAAVERMARRKVHAEAERPILHGRLECFGQIDEQFESVRCPRAAPRDDHRILSRHEHAGRFADRAGIARRRRGERQLRDAQGVAIGLWNWLFLHHGVRDDHDRTHGGCHG